MTEAEYDSLMEPVRDGKPITLDDMRNAVDWMIYEGVKKYPGTRAETWLYHVLDLLHVVEA